MASNSLVFGLVVLGVTAGVGMVVMAEAFHGLEILLPLGGVVGLLAIAGLTALVMAVDEPPDADAGH